MSQSSGSAAPLNATTNAPSDGPAKGSGALAAAWLGARRRWFVAGLVGSVLGGGAAAAFFTQTPLKYTLTTTLQIEAIDPLLHQRDSSNLDIEYRRAQVALVRARPVIRKALENPKVANSQLLKGKEDPVGWLETEIKTTGLDGGQIRLSLTGESPEELATTLNAVTAAYLTTVVDADETRRRFRSDDLDKVLASSEERVRKQRSELRGIATSLQTSDNQSLTLRQQVVLQQYAGLQKELSGVESQIRTANASAEVQKKSLEAVKNEPIPENAIVDALAADPAVKTMAEALQRLRDQVEGMAGTIRTGSPAHEKLLVDVKSAEEKLAKVKTQRREPVLAQLRESYQRQYIRDLALSESNIKMLEAQKKSLKGEVDTAKQDAEKIGLGSFDLEQKRTEIAEAESILRTLRGERERLEIEKQTYRRRVSVSSEAEAFAAKPAASAITTAIGLGVAGFAAGFLGIGYLESRRRRLIQSQDVAQAMRLPVLGHLPLVSGLSDGPLTGIWGDRFGITGTLLAEAVADLRTILLAPGDRRAPKVVVISSAGQGEGKTTIACLLAQSLSQLGKRTLLVDGDLRNPHVSERLGLPTSAGLGEVLRGEAKVAGVIGNVPDTKLAVLSAGRPCTDIIRGLSVERVGQLFDELRLQFDYIIVDTCPTPLADGLVIGACADAAVLVVRSGLSSEPLVREACERMVAARVPLLGGVVNGLPISRKWLKYPYTVLPESRPVSAVSEATVSA